MPAIDPATFAVRDRPEAAGDAKAEAANRLSIRRERPPKETRALADVAHVCNPSLFSIGGIFQLTVTVFADGEVQFECADLYGTVGGCTTVRAADVPMPYEKFVNYGDQNGDRLAQICWVTDADDGRVKLVIGRGLADDSAIFRKVKWEIELQPVAEFELMRILRRHEASRVIRRARVKRSRPRDTGSAGALLSALRAMRASEANP